MNEDTWEVIKKFYRDNFNVQDDLVDLVADSGILLMCVSGSSVDSISKYLNIDYNSVKSVINLVLGFDGWEEDLPLNPFRTFSYLAGMNKPSFKDFKNEVSVSYNSTEDQIKTMFRVCRIYEKINVRIMFDWT